MLQTLHLIKRPQTFPECHLPARRFYGGPFYAVFSFEPYERSTSGLTPSASHKRNSSFASNARRFLITAQRVDGLISAFFATVICLPARTCAGRANTSTVQKAILCAKCAKLPFCAPERRTEGNRLRSTKRPVSLRGWRQNRPGRFYKGRLRFRTKLSPRTLRFPRRIRWACLNKPAQKSV